jgi:hypothetical protein
MGCHKQISSVILLFFYVEDCHYDYIKKLKIDGWMDGWMDGLRSFLLVDKRNIEGLIGQTTSILEFVGLAYYQGKDIVCRSL